MNKVEKTTVRVEKTDKLDQVKLARIARKYQITPISVREIQLGFPEEISKKAADLLVADGYVKIVRSKCRTQQERCDSLTTQPKEITATTEDVDTLMVKTDESVTGDPKEESETV